MLLTLRPGAEQVAEKIIERSNLATVDAAGAQAHTHFGSFIGPAKAEPLLQDGAKTDFFAASEAMLRYKPRARRRDHSACYSEA
jgi:hypothetical protein